MKKEKSNKSATRTNSAPKIAELLTTSVAERTKWNRKKGKKLSKKIYVARLIFLDETGKKREKTKEFNIRYDAEDYNREQRIKYERSGGGEIEAEKMTFNELADYYEQFYAKAAEYSGEQKVAGLRSLKAIQGYIVTLRNQFGNLKLKKITYGHLRDFRASRLETPVVIKTKVKVSLTEQERKILKTRKNHRMEWQEKTHARKIASVNRELATLRRMFNIAHSEGWIPKNPFNSGKPLINLSDEKIRQRVLSIEEEQRLLAVCNCDERRHLKAIIICLLDTGLRFNEAITLTWNDVDLENSLINIKAFNSKTAKPKTVPISARLKSELIRLNAEQITLKGAGINVNSDLVFGITSNVNRSWRTARRLAGLEEVRIHDLRHTTGTRLDRKGLSQAAIARILGHQQTSTTYRYINADNDLLEIAKSALESYHLPEFVKKETDLIN